MQDHHPVGQPVAAAPAPGWSSDTNGALQRGALAILVVDDDRVVGQMIADGLAAMGHAVLTALSAGEARLLLQERHDIGVVVSDIRMPGCDGVALALDVATQLGDARAASTVLITGHATAQEVQEAIQKCAADFLPKPCRLSELLGAVERGLDKARTRRGQAALTNGQG